ncbi:unnamed protein product [Amoebophrya sp. A120]|nr:unnamed protein product [Amoebophrya sp. A120]|eukprot:GSA120T00007935001.1
MSQSKRQLAANAVTLRAEALLKLFAGKKGPPINSTFTWSRIAPHLNSRAVCGVISTEEAQKIVEALAHSVDSGVVSRDEEALEFPQSSCEEAAWRREMSNQGEPDEIEMAPLHHNRRFSPKLTELRHLLDLRPLLETALASGRAAIEAAQGGAYCDQHLALHSNALPISNSFASPQQLADLCTALTALARSGMVGTSKIFSEQNQKVGLDEGVDLLSPFLTEAIPRYVATHATSFSLPQFRRVLELYFWVPNLRTGRPGQRQKDLLADGAKNSFAFASYLATGGSACNSEIKDDSPGADLLHLRQMCVRVLQIAKAASSCAAPGRTVAASSVQETHFASIVRSFAFLGYVRGAMEILQEVLHVVPPAQNSAATKSGGSLGRTRSEFQDNASGIISTAQHIDRLKPLPFTAWVYVLEAELLLKNAYDAQQKLAFRRKFPCESSGSAFLPSSLLSRPAPAISASETLLTPPNNKSQREFRHELAKQRKWLARYEEKVPGPDFLTSLALLQQQILDTGREAMLLESQFFKKWTRLLVLMVKLATRTSLKSCTPVSTTSFQPQPHVPQRPREEAENYVDSHSATTSTAGAPATFLCFRELAGESVKRLAQTPKLALLCLRHADLDLPKRLWLVEECVRKKALKLRVGELILFCEAADRILEEIAAFFESEKRQGGLHLGGLKMLNTTAVDVDTAAASWSCSSPVVLSLAGDEPRNNLPQLDADHQLVAQEGSRELCDLHQYSYRDKTDGKIQALLFHRLRALVDELAAVYATREEIVLEKTQQSQLNGFFNKWLLEKPFFRQERGGPVRANDLVEIDTSAEPFFPLSSPLM